MEMMELTANCKSFERLSLVGIDEFCDLLEESTSLERFECANLVAHSVQHPKHGLLTLINSPGGCLVIFC